MFESLTDKLELTFKKLRGQGKITEKNIDDALREVRLALLEADVHLKVVKTFSNRSRAKSLGQEVLQSLTPEQQFIKIVRDELIDLLGGEYQRARPQNCSSGGHHARWLTRFRQNDNLGKARPASKER